MIFETTTQSPEDPAAQMRWRALWQVSPQRSSFSSLEYVRAVASAYGLQCQMHLLSHAGQDEAGALLCWRKRGPWRDAVLPPFTQYSALLLRSPSSESIIHEQKSALGSLLDVLENHYSRLQLMVDLTDIRPATWQGWHVQPLYTYRSHLLSSSWSDAPKRTFRQHAAAYTLREDPGSVDAIVALCEQSYKRQNRPMPGKPEQLRQLLRSLATIGQAYLFTATPTGKRMPTAGLAVLHDTRMAHYWVTGSVPGTAMTILLGHTLLQLQKQNVTTFDFVGANTPSIAEFKRRFGPRLISYFHVQKITSPGLRLLSRLRGKG